VSGSCARRRADLLDYGSVEMSLKAEEQVAFLAGEAADMHAALGANALLSLWGGFPR
jgi:hypothetical protein